MKVLSASEVAAKTSMSVSNVRRLARELKPNSFDELARVYAEAEKSGAFVS